LHSMLCAQSSQRNSNLCVVSRTFAELAESALFTLAHTSLDH
jgi:hypothetical protein